MSAGDGSQLALSDFFFGLGFGAGVVEVVETALDPAIDHSGLSMRTLLRNFNGM